MKSPIKRGNSTDIPLTYRTVDQILRDAAERLPANEALVVRHQNIRLTYAQLDAEVDRIARALIALGLKPGERLGIWSPNRVEWVLTQFATARAGVILVNINPAYRTSELDHVLTKTGCRALILATSFKSSDYIGMLQQLLTPPPRGCRHSPQPPSIPPP